jgi:tungstate transport system ATP-binding protein
LIEAKLAVRDLRLVRGGKVLLDIRSLDVLRGETLAIVGPNGAGKSALLQVLALLERPTSGQLFFDGQLVEGSLLAHRRDMAVVFQEPLLLDTSVKSNIRMGLALRGVPRREQDRRVAHWLERFAIAGLAERSHRQLSGGEAQRVSLARALALAPEVLLLDEPLAALDVPTREALMDDLERVLSETGTTTIYVTHDRGEALRLGHRVAVMMGGRMRQVAPADQVFGSPADEEVAAFVGVETIAAGRVLSQEGGVAAIDVAGHRIEAAVDAPVMGDVLICVRPEDVTLAVARDSGPLTSARNRLQGHVQRVLPRGAQMRVVLDCGFPLVALITKQSLEDLDLKLGDAVVAAFKATAVHLIPYRGGS